MAVDHRLGSVARRLAATQRVLVVEDEHDIADFLRAYFRASGFDLIHIDPDSPAAVIEAIDEHQPDCVLLDLGLRGFSGAEAYRQTRREDRFDHVPMIIVTARSDAKALLPSLAPVDEIVTKPFNVNKLAALVVERMAVAGLDGPDAGADAAGLTDRDHVESCLVEQLTVTAPQEAASFALLRLRGQDEVVMAVGRDGATYAVRELVRRLRGLVPDEATLGLTHHDELAVLLPGMSSQDATKLLTFAIDSIREVVLPGGARVPLSLSAGVAAYPQHASDADGVYMAADVALADAVERSAPVAVAL
jgi:CheY-like chemotaxis protein